MGAGPNTPTMRLAHEHSLIFLATLACLLAVAAHSNTTWQAGDDPEQPEEEEHLVTTIQPYSTEFARSVAKLEGDLLDTLAGFVVGIFGQISAAWGPSSDTNSSAAPPQDPRLLKII